MSVKFLLKSFAGGEITPELAGRIDLVKYQTGLALARNFITLPHGPAVRRPGFQYILEAKDSTRAVRLMPFAFSATQTVILEFGHQYIRFHLNGGTQLEASKAIVSIVADTVTVTSHGYSTGDWVYIGTRYHKVTSTGANTFTTTDLWGVATTASGSTAARVYTLTSPYTEDDLFDLHFAQSADITTITHPSYATRELARVSATSWTLTTLAFDAPTNAPTDLSVEATIENNSDKVQQSYVVTTIDADGVTESLASDPVNVQNNLGLAGNYNTLTWSPVGDAIRYNAYKLRGGTYGYIGQTRPSPSAVSKSISTIDRPGAGNKTVTVTTTSSHGFANNSLIIIEDTGEATLNGAWIITVTGTTTFTYLSVTDATTSAATGTASVPELVIKDDNIQEDTTQTPPEDIVTLNAGTDDYPSTSTYHEQRRWFGGTNNKPQVLFATRTGTEANLTTSLYSRDDDAMEIKMSAGQYNQIRHLVSLSDLIAFTAGGEFRIFNEGGAAVTPSSISIKPQGYTGASNVQPVVTSGSALYVQAQGSRVRELAYKWESSNYSTIDVSIMAPHRFNGYTINQIAYSRAPDQILWAVRSDGTLAAMTYVPDQQVYGWHFHDTDGTFESVAVVAEGNDDAVYAVIKRTIDGRDVRYIERLHSRIFTDQEDGFYVDSGLTYDSTATTTITGLWHIEGEEVAVLADGAVHPNVTVTDGSITLEEEASVVQVGLAYTSDIKTLPLAMEGAPATGQGTVKNVNKVHLRVSQTGVIQVGPSFTTLREYPARDVTDDYDNPPGLITGEVVVSVQPSWNQDAAICVRQDKPLPMSVLSMTLEVQGGG